MANSISGTDNSYTWADLDRVTQGTATNQTQSTVGTTSLGKDAFLKLLVAQMQYQDPLNPSSDTEWIAQMAQFSSLEEMQNMGQTMTNTQAFQLVGQYVIVKEDSGSTASSSTALKAGKVDYVTLESGKAYICMNGKTYDYDNLDSVVSNDYIEELSGVSGSATTDDIVKLLQEILDKSSSGADAMQQIKDLYEQVTGNSKNNSDSGADSSEETK